MTFAYASTDAGIVSSIAPLTIHQTGCRAATHVCSVTTGAVVTIKLGYFPAYTRGILSAECAGGRQGSKSVREEAETRQPDTLKS